MSDDHLIFDRTLVAHRRDRVAAAAAGHAYLLERVADDLAERLAIVRRTFPLALSLGAAHGLLARRMSATGSIGAIVEAELAPRLLAQCGPLRVVADEEALPFRDASLDLVLAGLTLHLVNDLPGALVQVRRALRPDGLLLAALLGGQTLVELRQAWLAAEMETTGGASPRVAPFADVRELGGLLQRAGFALPVVDSDVVRVAYPTPLDLMRDVKAMGGSNPLAERSRRPTSRRTLLRAAEIYAERFSRPDGRVEATFEIVTLTGWVPHESQQKPLRPGSASMRLADALGVDEHKIGRDAD
jgi:SAM-dependent methyltransferase